MAESVKNKFFSGIVWSFIQNVVIRILGFVFTIILTRLLTPEDFGLIGMITVFVSISDVFIISGFGEALVQKQNCTDDDYSTAFYFNITISFLIYAILFFAAPLIADFYHEPQLILLTRILSLNFVLGSFNIVQRSKLTKSMEFRPLAVLSLISSLTGGIIGVSMAFMGYGVWSLVAQTLCCTFASVVLFPFFTQWTPNRPFNMESFKQLWQYGSRLLVTGTLNVIIHNISSILIGRYYNKEQVGYFSRSQTLAEVPAGTAFAVLNIVTFPALCKFQDDKERQIAAYKRILFNTVLVTSPIMILLALLAKPLIIVLFTEKWLACVPLLQALLLARMFMPIGATHTSLLRSVGNTTLYMKLYFITGPLTLVAIAVSIPFGVVAMAWATFIGNFIAYLIPSYVIGNKFGYSLFQQIWDWRFILLSLIMMSTCVLLSTYWINNVWLQLLIGGFIGILVFLGCCAIFRLADDDLKKMVFSKLHIKL